MQKIATIFLLTVSLGMVFAGAVSAEDPSVQVGVVGEISPGNTVGVDVLAEANDEQVLSPYVSITINPETSLDLDEQNALMSVNGVNWVVNSDPVSGGFLYWNAANEEWIWDIGQFGDLDPGEFAEIVIPALVKQSEEITVLADLNGLIPQTRDYETVASDSITLQSGTPIPVRGGTIPMQDTGTPIALATLGLFGIIGGAVYGKLR